MNLQASVVGTGDEKQTVPSSASLPVADVVTRTLVPSFISAIFASGISAVVFHRVSILHYNSLLAAVYLPIKNIYRCDVIPRIGDTTSLSAIFA